MDGKIVQLGSTTLKSNTTVGIYRNQNFLHLISLALVCYTLLILPCLAHATECKPTGTFSSLYYNDESGDLSGHELLITTDQSNNYQAVYQQAEGFVYELATTTIHYEGCSISFSIPDYPRPVSFEGEVTQTGMHGTLIWLQSGFAEEIFLRRKCSYWDCQSSEETNVQRETQRPAK